MARRILVIEDNREIADLVSLHLRDMGCDEYQGFIDGSPGPLDEVLAMRP